MNALTESEKAEIVDFAESLIIRGSINPGYENYGVLVRKVCSIAGVSNIRTIEEIIRDDMNAMYQARKERRMELLRQYGIEINKLIDDIGSVGLYQEFREATDELKIARELYEMADREFEDTAFKRVEAAKARCDAILATAKAEHQRKTA